MVIADNVDFSVDILPQPLGNGCGPYTIVLQGILVSLHGRGGMGIRTPDRSVPIPPVPSCDYYCHQP